MKVFNPDKELYKIQKGNRNKIILLLFLLLVVGLMGYSFALYQVRYSKRIIYTKVGKISKDLNLAVYLNGEKQNKAPEKGSGYKFLDMICDTPYEGNASWDDTKALLSLPPMPIPDKCNVYLINDDYDGIKEFNYNGTDGSDGSIQEYTIPKDGIYKLEVWGAKGGSYNSTNCQGGLGGYSVGKISLEKNDVLYIAVGGAGSGNGTHVYRAGGYNGGGDASPNADANSRQSSGGGATHIAMKTGLLKELENYKENILIVAGGGGGGGGNAALMCVSGGTGGGANGGTSAIYHEGTYPESYGTGGTQNEPGTSFGLYGHSGSFGLGGSCIASGGGGGYYGGGCGFYSSGGGSGYLNPKLINAQTINDQNTGNGKAKITYLGET